MAPEIRWGVFRNAVLTKTIPPGCLGLLAYLFAVAPEHIKSEELAEAVEISRGTLRELLRRLETAGFIRLHRGSRGKTVELLMPPGWVQTVKAGHTDTSISPAVPLHVTAKRGLSQAPDCQTRAITEPVIAKRELSENPVIANPGLSQTADGQTKAIMTGEFLKGMLEALENGSKQGKSNPSCPDNNETKSP